MEFEEIFALERSKEQAELAARLIRDQPSLIEILLQHLASDNMMDSQKAAHVFHKITDLDRYLLAPFQEKILPLLNAPVHVSVKRCILRLYSIIEVHDKIAGLLVNECFTILTNHDQPPAIKVYAMTTIAAIAQKYPDLMQELRQVLEEQMPYASVGFKSRAVKILSGTYRFGNL